jgi:hypothetical protein
MNEEKARKCLQFDPFETISPEKCKQRYRRLALRFHPDKNKSENAESEFQAIVDAYEYLSSTRPTVDYKTLCVSFLKSLWGENNEINEIIVAIFSKLSQLAILDIQILKKCVASLPISSLKKITKILERYSDVFHLAPFLAEGLRQLVEELEIQEVEEQTNIPIVYIYPCIDDVLEGKVYTWKYKDTTYIVPLWHREVTFDVPCDDDVPVPYSEICVKCKPMLGENVTMSGDHIVIHLSYHYSDLVTLMKQSEIEFYLGEKRFAISRERLYLRDYHKYCLKGQGIPIADKNEPLSIEKRGDIVIQITFTD